METRNLRKERTGVVTSNKMDKSITVSIKWKEKHPIYGKRDLAPSFTASKDSGRRNDNAGGNRGDKNFKRKKANR